jgi:transketolase
MLYHINQKGYQTLLQNRDISNIEKTEIFALYSRINTLYSIAKAGSGHIGTSFSSMDIFSWMYLNVLTDDDLFFSSKGHDAPGLYSVLIGIGKIEYNQIHRLRRLNGLPGHPDVTTTPCMVTNTGSLGMGISKAKGMVRANRLDNKQGRVYVLTGDGELQEGQFWESLSGAVNGKFEEITVIIDHNKIQSDTWVKDVSDLGDLENKLLSFGWHVQSCDGHNLSDFSKAIETAKTVKGKPQIIIAETVKGQGVSFMEATAMRNDQEFYKYHSGAPSSEEYQKAFDELFTRVNNLLDERELPPLKIVEVERERNSIPKDNVQKMIPAYEKALHELGGKNRDIVVLDADLMIDCGLLSFRNSYPERFVECGIAEQDMLSQAGALALRGKLPISHSFACFLAPRANEQFFNNASEKTKCIYTGSLAGLVPAGPGHSHQMVRDISALGSVPGLTLIEPCCEQEVKMVLEYAVKDNPESTYIRLVSIPCEIPYTLPADYTLNKGEGVALTEGNDAIIFAYGPVMLPQAYKAAQKLKTEHGKNVKVVNIPWLNTINKTWLKEIIGNVKQIYTLDNHLMSGGQGEKIGSVIAQLGLDNISLKMLGLTGIPVCGLNDEVIVYYELDTNSIVKVIANSHSSIRQV